MRFWPTLFLFCVFLLAAWALVMDDTEAAILAVALAILNQTEASR